MFVISPWFDAFFFFTKNLVQPGLRDFFLTGRIFCLSEVRVKSRGYQAVQCLTEIKCSLTPKTWSLFSIQV